MAASLLVLALFGLAMSLPARDPAFTVDTYFPGSWVLSSSVLSTNGGEAVENPEKYMYNITKSADALFAVDYIDIASNTAVKEKSVVCELLSNMTCALKHSADSEQFMKLNFIPISSKGIYVRAKHLCDVDFFWSEPSQQRRVV